MPFSKSPIRILVWAWLILLVGLSACTPAKTPSPTTGLVFVGSYTQPGQQGISIFRFDPARAALNPLGKAGDLPNPSFLVIDPSQRYLLAVSESGDFQGQASGAVSSYRIEAATGALALINSQPSGGTGPCYLSVSPNGKWVFVANYGGGSVAVLPLGEDGRLGQPVSVVQHHGSGADPARQEGPHAHAIQMAPGAQNLVLAADLGLDQVLIYDFDPVRGSLTPHTPPALGLPPGSGPRHFSFHPSLPFLYLVSELTSRVTVFKFDASAGTFQEIQSLPLLPDGYSGRNTSADIHISPDGKTLYASNRGDDSLASFHIDPSSGQLAALAHTPSGGKTPRNFAIDPSGSYLLAANQDSGSLATFRIDPSNGKLTLAGPPNLVDHPMCVLFMLP